MKTILQHFPKFFLACIMIASFNSCDNDTDEVNRELEVQKSTVYDIISNNSSRKGAPKKGDTDIATIASSNENFEELFKAVVYVSENTDVNVAALLSGTDQYTVFAPTDAAFEDLYDTLGVDSIYEIDAELVLNVLLYHVTDGRRASNSVVPKNNAKTIETQLEDATFEVTSSLQINAIGNTANILTADISASNGIIHLIDTVLLPIVL